MLDYLSHEMSVKWHFLVILNDVGREHMEIYHQIIS